MVGRQRKSLNYLKVPVLKMLTCLCTDTGGKVSLQHRGKMSLRHREEDEFMAQGGR